MSNLDHIQLFRGEEHQPFLWQNGRPAALFLHGFPGTPAEIRPLAHTLHNAGWTVQGLLMPGFGPQITTLLTRNYQEWVDAAHQALLALQKTHKPVLLVGYSMGGAVALHVTAVSRPHGLILLAPFWQLGNRFHGITWNLIKPFVRRIRPLRKANFSHPQLRRALNSLLPDANLDDPVIQEALRSLYTPVHIMDQLRQIGKTAVYHAPRATCPTLVLQGTQDVMVSPPQTRQLLQKLPGSVQYVEVEADHHLINAQTPIWSTIERHCLDFSQHILATVGK